MITMKLYFERNSHKTTREATPMKGSRQQWTQNGYAENGKIWKNKESDNA